MAETEVFSIFKCRNMAIEERTIHKSKTIEYANTAQKALETMVDDLELALLYTRLTADINQPERVDMRLLIRNNISIISDKLSNLLMYRLTELLNMKELIMESKANIEESSKQNKPIDRRDMRYILIKPIIRCMIGIKDALLRRNSGNRLGTSESDINMLISKALEVFLKKDCIKEVKKKQKSPLDCKIENFTYDSINKLRDETVSVIDQFSKWLCSYMSTIIDSFASIDTYDRLRSIMGTSIEEKAYCEIRDTKRAIELLKIIGKKKDNYDNILYKHIEAPNEESIITEQKNIDAYEEEPEAEQ